MPLDSLPGVDSRSNPVWPFEARSWGVAMATDIDSHTNPPFPGAACSSLSCRLLQADASAWWRPCLFSLSPSLVWFFTKGQN